MAHLALLWKARTIEKYRLKYEKAKLHSIEIMNAQNTQNKSKTLYQRLCHYNSNTKKRISKTFLRFYPEGSAVYNFFYYLRTDQTFPNFLIKSVIGFVGGIILTYLCFMFFVFQLSISLIHATIMSSVIGVLLTLGLAFSYRIRCLVFLLIPQFFSRVGRYTLTCYALVLILTGPATNTLKNSEVLSESLACVEEQIKTNTYQINEAVRKPYNSMKDSIGLMVGGVKQLASKIKKSTMNLHRLTLSLAHSLQSSFTWLNAVADSCNRSLGSPYNRCNQAIQNSIIECQAILGPWYSWLCDAGKLVKVACWPVKPLPAFCHVFDFTNGNILAVVTKKLNTFTQRINSMLYLEVHVHHSYSFRSNSSRSASQVAAGIVTEIRNKADLMLTWLSWSSCVTSASLLLIIFRAKYYQNMYETRSRFDNRYVTKELIELDLKRLRQGKETVLPLNKREEGKYIKTTSFRLVSSERVHLSRSAVTITITTFKLLIHMVADYSLYWVLMTIRHHGLNQTPLKAGNPNSGPFVSGSALISKILMSLVGSITLPLATPPPSTITCLPNPHPPDFHRYLQIGILIFLLWFFALFEPYGLRLRHVIMGLYRPERAKARAVWLFNHIQRTRGSFLKFARRKLHREFKYSTENQHTFRRWLQEHVPCAPLKYFLGIYPDEPYCVLCGVIEDFNECDGQLISCETPGCPGVYCTKCFSDIGELCTVCLKPADYGDYSDVSLAKGSSEESDDEDPKCPNQCQEEVLHKDNDDDDDEGPSTSQSKHKRRWSLFRKNNSKNAEEYPLLELKEEKETPKVSDKKRSKAMEVRHKRYTDDDLRDERRRVIVSLGEDTQCLMCHNHCEVCAMGRPDNLKINNVQKVMQGATNNQTINNNRYYKINIRRNSNTHRKEDCNDIKNMEEETRESKHNSSINESLAKFKQHLKQMRKYNLNKKYSQTIIRIKSSRTIILKIPSSLKFRRTSRKRKRRLKALSKSTSIFFNPIIISSSRRVCSNQKRIRQCRLKKQLTISRFGYKIISLIENIRTISSTAVECSKFSDNNFVEFNKDDGGNISLAMDNGKENYLSIPGASNFQTDKNIFQKEEPLKMKDEKQDKNAPKIAENKKFGRKAGKLYSFCASYWNVGRIFAPPVRVVNYFRNDHVPVLYDTTNHKKRKKVESSETVKPRTSKKDNEATRKYRLSTFLSEQDWMKKRCKESKSKIAVDVKEDVLNELLDAESEATKELFRKTILDDKKDAVCGKGDNKDNKEHSPKKHKTNDRIRLPESQTEKPLNDSLRFSALRHKMEDKKRLSEFHNKMNENGFPEKEAENTDNMIKNPPHQLKEVKYKTRKEIKAAHHKKIRIHKKETDEKKVKLNSKQNQEESLEEVENPLNKSNQNKDNEADLTPGKFSNYQLAEDASSAGIIATRVPSQSMDYGGMSMSRSLEYYRSLGNRDFDPYVNFQDPASAEKVMNKEVKEIQAVVQVNVEDAKAQTSDELARKKSIEENPAYRLAYFNKSAGDTAAKISENKPKDKNVSKTQSMTKPCKEMKKSSKERKKPPKEMKKSSKEMKKPPKEIKKPSKEIKKIPEEMKKPSKEIKKASKEMKVEKAKSVNNVHKTKSERSNNPFSMIVRWCHVHLERKKRVETSTNLNIPCLNDVEVGVFPVVQNNYCQYGETMPLQDQTTQVFLLKEMAQSMSHHSEMFRDVGIDAVTKLRNDSTQYTYSCRNAMTYCTDKRLKQRNPHKDASTIHFNSLKFDVERDTMTMQNPTQNTAVQCYMPLKFNEENTKDYVQDYNMTVQHGSRDIAVDDLKDHNKKTKINEILQEFKSATVRPEKKQTEMNNRDKTKCPHCGAHSSSETTSSLGVFQSLPSMECTKYRNYDLESDSESKTGSDGDDTKTTDTTVYTVSNVGYVQPPRRRRTGKFKLSVVTKSNMATATEATKVCDVSTVTSDWWSPILERKNKRFTLEKKEVQVEIPAPKKKIFHDRGVGTEGRNVTFNSAAQIIPSMHTHLNLMSPSRYLLESQKYYNELFSTDCNERYSAEKRYSSNRRHVLKRKGYRVKRSDEPYTEKPQRILSPFMEQVWTAETVHQRDPSSIYQRKNRAQKNKEISPKGLQSKGVKKSKHPQRHGARKPELKIKRGEVNLLTRRYLSNENISLDSPCNSFTENGSF